MHMADALISPLVGGAMYIASGGISTLSIKKIELNLDEKKIPLMGVMGAFVFAAQMINFTIPGTGSSGHIGGALLLTVILGPYAAFLTMASILLIQALMFGDGGLLAYGCNVFNLGFYACFIAYPLIFKPLTKKGFSTSRIFVGSILAAVLGLQLGAFSVVLQTVLSGKTELPFGTFILLMQPIHLAIGVVEGLVTAAVINFVWKTSPEILETMALGKSLKQVSIRKVLVSILAMVLVTGGVLSWFASSKLDGLEWSIEKTVGTTEIEASSGVHEFFSKIQGVTAIFPDYAMKKSEDENQLLSAKADDAAANSSEQWPAINKETSFSGIFGGLMTLLLSVSCAFVIRFMKRRSVVKESLE